MARPTPNPRIGASVELSGGDARGLLNLIRVGKTLPSQRIVAEESPPAFLQVQPTSSFRDEDVVETGMLGQPRAGLGTVVAREIVGDDEEIAGRIIGFNVSRESDIVGGVARSGTSGELFAITHAECSIDPGFLRSATVVQHCFDAVPIRRPAGRWRKGAGNYWPELVGA